MPEQEGYARRRLEWQGGPLPPIPKAPFVELGLTTPFSFLRGAEETPVLVEDAALRDARLALALATRQVLANGLDLLGVSAPERM